MRELQVPGIYGMNQDALDSRLHNEVRLLHNGRNFRSNDGRDGTVRNILGTVIGMDDANFSANARYLGHAKYSGNNSVLVCLYDTGSVNGNSIVEYFPETNTYTLILKEQTPPVFNFSPDHILRGAYVIDGKFYWNDAYNSPRKININKAKLFTAGDLVNGYSVVDNQTIELIKYPPLYPMNPYYATVSSKGVYLGVGTVSATYGGTTVTGTGTSFTKILNIGDTIIIGITTAKVTVVTSDTQLTVDKQTLTYTDVAFHYSKFYNGNRLRGKLFQFKYAYIYDDDELSVPSQVSKVPLPSNELTYNGAVLGDLQVNNCIKFNINIGHSTVKKIVVYSRIGNLGLWGIVETLNRSDVKGTLGDFGYYEYSFYNDRVIEITDQVKINEPYHAVPYLSDEMGYIHSNQILLAGNTEGQGNITVDVNILSNLSIPVFPVVPAALVSSFPMIAVGQSTSYPITGWTTTDWGILINVDHLPVLNNVIKILATSGWINDNNLQFIVSDADIGAFTTTLRNTIEQKYGASYTSVTLDTQYFLNSILIKYPIELFYEPPIYDISEYTNGGTIKITSGGFKAGAEQQFGMMYYGEAARSCFVQPIKSVYLSSLPEVKTAGGTPVQNSIYEISWEVNHIPPLWATKYQFCRQKNKTMVNFSQYIIGGIKNGDPKYPNNSLIDISPLNLHRVQYNGLDHSFPNSSISAYSWQKGDRIRFITAAKTDFSSAEGLGDIISNYYDYEILGYEVSDPADATTTVPQHATNNLIVQEIGLTNNNDFTLLGTGTVSNAAGGTTVTGTGTVFSSTFKVGDSILIGNQTVVISAIASPLSMTTEIITLSHAGTQYYYGVGKNCLVEIYTPKLEQDNLSYWEMGEIFDVLNPNTVSRVHQGQTQNQTLDGSGNSLLPATGKFDKGDVYLTPVVFSVNLGDAAAAPYIALIENMSFSTFYDLQDYNIGRVSIPDENTKQKKVLSIRASDVYFENTQVNGLSAFYAGKDLFVSAEFGQDVTGLDEVGFSLKVLQSRKITTFFVGRQGLQISSDATNQIQATSADVLSTKSPSQEMYGCINPESVLSVNRNLYFADIRNGAILRDAPNGMVDITNYGLHSTLNNLFTSLKGMDSNRIMASFNPLTKEVGFTFVGITGGVETDLGTYYFNEELDKWNSKWDYKESGLCPMGFADINQSYISFVGKKIWLHEKGARNLIYGSQLPMTIEMIFNANAGNSKLYKTLEIEGIGTWSCPNEGDVLIEAKNSNIKRDQKSRLVAAKFQNVKGVMIAPFMKDMNTQNGTDKIFNLMNGHDLKGNILSLTLTNNDTSEAVLDTVVVTSQILGI